MKLSQKVVESVEKAKQIGNKKIDFSKTSKTLLSALALSSVAGSHGTSAKVENTNITQGQKIEQKTIAQQNSEEKTGETLTPDQEKKLQEKLKLIDGKHIFTFENVDLILEKNGYQRKTKSDDKLNLKDAALFLKNPRLEKGNYIADVVNTAGDSNLHKLEVNLGKPTQLYKNFDSLLENKDGVIGSFVILGVDFYDNKIANISLATDRINQKFLNDGLAPGQEFSYLKYGDIGQLIRTKALPGKALGPNGTHPIVAGGGICALATAYKLAANTSENNVLKVKYSKPHSRDNYLINRNAPLEAGEWKDATAYNPSIDIILKNMYDKPLYIETGVSIATDPVTPINKNGLESYSTFLVANVKVQKTPVSQSTIENNIKEYNDFAAQRPSIKSKLPSLR